MKGKTTGYSDFERYLVNMGSENMGWTGHATTDFRKLDKIESNFPVKRFQTICFQHWTRLCAEGNR